MKNFLKMFNKGLFIATVSITVSSLIQFQAEAGDLRSWDRRIDNANKRFKVLAEFDNQAVLDKETQIVWHIAPNGQKRTWSGAYNSCFAGMIGGRGGWRLPYMDELTSLIDRSQDFPPLPEGHPFDVSNLTSDVWSVNTVPGTNQAFIQDMVNDGFLGSVDKEFTLNFWCVRGGRGASDGQ